jgi:hypothetical protein
MLQRLFSVSSVVSQLLDFLRGLRAFVVDFEFVKKGRVLIHPAFTS